MNVLAIAIGALVVEMIGALAIFIVSSKIYNYKLKDRFLDMWKPILGSFVMSAALYGISLIGLSNIVTLCIQIVVGVIVYLLMAKITKDDNMSYCLSIIKDMITKNK